MYHLRLIKALSYIGVINAEKDNPDVYTDDKDIAEKAIATGYFKMIDDEVSDDIKIDDEVSDDIKEVSEDPEKTLEKMNVSELQTFAAYNNISLKGVTKKADIISKLKAELDIEETDGIDYGSPTVTELQEG